MIEVTIGSILTKVKRVGKLKNSEYLKFGKYPVIDQGDGQYGGYSNDKTIVHFSPLPIVIFGDHTRRIKLAKTPFICGADGTQLLYPDNEFDPVYLYYAVKNVDLSNYHYARHFKFLKDQLIIKRDKGVQKKIAGILSAYDDAIENNLRRIKLLEEMAQITYEEWFVHLRFPGHTTTPINKATGLPDGWVEKTITDAISVNPRTKPNANTEAPYVPMSSLSESSMVIDNIETRIPSGGTKFKNGDTLFARISPCLENGKTGFVQFMNDDNSVATGSTEYIVLRETASVNRYFIYCLSRSEFFRENSINSSS